MDIEAAVKEITGPCECDLSYTSRGLIDMSCIFHGVMIAGAQGAALAWIVQICWPKKSAPSSRKEKQNDHTRTS